MVVWDIVALVVVVAVVVVMALWVQTVLAHKEAILRVEMEVPEVPEVEVEPVEMVVEEVLRYMLGAEVEHWLIVA